MRTKSVFLLAIAVLCSACVVVLIIKQHQRNNIIALANNTLADHLSSAEFETYKLAEIKKVNDKWFITYLNRVEGVLGNEITVLIENNNVTILDSE